MDNTNHNHKLINMSDNEKLQYILNQKEEKVRASLLSFLNSDDYIARVILSFTSDELKLECIKLINSDFYKVKVLYSLNDKEIFWKNLKMINSSYQVQIINQLDSEEEKLKYSRIIDKENQRMYVLETITDDKLKIESLSLVSRDYNKSKIICSVSDEKVRYDLLSKVGNELEKLKIIETLSLDLQKDAIKLLNSDLYKCEVIKQLPEESDRFSMLGLLTSDDCKEKIIRTFTSDKLKFESIDLIKDQYYKSNVVKGFKGTDKFAKALKLISASYQVKVINELDKDIEKLELLELVDRESYRVDIVDTITDDRLKVEALKMFSRDLNKSKIIASIKEENLKYSLLDEISDESKKVSIIISLKQENLIYDSILKLNNEYNKAQVLINIDNDDIKGKYLSLIESDELKVNIINSMNDDLKKVSLIDLLSNDEFKIQVIVNITGEQLRIDLSSTLENVESKFNILVGIKNNDIKLSGLRIIPDYLNHMKIFFEKGFYEYLYHFESKFLKRIFDDSQIKVLKEYSSINDEKLRIAYSNYVSSNYKEINMDNLDKITTLLSKIEVSNSNELQAFGDFIANQVLKQDEPLQYFEKIEHIFVKNNMPYVCKVYEVFKMLHSDIESYTNYSPLLNSFSGAANQIEMLDSIIWGDLLKCSFESNNRSLKKFVYGLESSNELLIRVFKNNSLIGKLSDADLECLNGYLDQIELILDYVDKDNKGLLTRINNIINYLDVYEDLSLIPDIIIQKMCGGLGIETLKDAKNYFDIIVNDANNKNRDSINMPFVLEEGDFVKGINDVKYLCKILQNGSVAKEFLGDSSGSDVTPLDTDLSRILEKDLVGKSNNELGKIISSTLSDGYGSTWIVLKNNSNIIEITRDSKDKEVVQDYSLRYNKLEAFKTLQDGHYGIRTGFPSSQISYIVSEDEYEKIGLEIAMNGFYIPVVDMDGNLIFTPDDYDNLRKTMSGLSYYGEDTYVFSDNLINDETTLIVKEINKCNKETMRKSNLINSIIKDSLFDFGLKFKNRIDGDLSEGSAEFIDIGSTGRFTNLLDTGDFDFFMRLDRSVLINEDKMNDLRNNILKRFDKRHVLEVTGDGDFRLKNVQIDSDTVVDIDITFTRKTDTISYSTEMCLYDRFTNIYNQSIEKYNYILANIILAKQVLKEGGVYKSAMSENPEGGLGGVGIETWILQNGGSFIDAARTFLSAADNNNFETFKKNYFVWDLGESHMFERSGEYLHPNFVKKNMSRAGYNKMVQVLSDYLKKYE